ncbi:M90 family metallopeptidase [Pseudanabaena sp. FACHB-2040]|uniref:M90 family metallopeptidase n=1 Tax=Pseudanabaena sp. FACHB-2040 TaxID=2692859 RepID=UPI0016838FB2|nr:M90 family metallopeptidase [Pseudanabaena sp. FACHB-2040]MBD2260028.1 zinc-dependent peptidase [Pseudanabaena sp. FACHB-2040]
MLQALIVLLTVSLIAVGIFIQPLLQRQHRERLKKQPLPPLWRALIEQNLPIYHQLSPNQRQRLQGHIQVFLAEKQFIGCRGLQVSEEMKVTIAAVACLLLLNERSTYFPKLKSILIYPDAYIVKQPAANGPYVVEERQEVRLGESWSRDQVLLTWQEIQADARNWRDGHNLILHEFAHQLDQEDGKAEGVPILKKRTDYVRWREVMSNAYDQLCQAVGRRYPTVMDSYGTKNPAEFFAVATETFFEKPRQLRAHHPALYTELEQYYQLDPAAWG